MNTTMKPANVDKIENLKEQIAVSAHIDPNTKLDIQRHLNDIRSEFYNLINDLRINMAARDVYAELCNKMLDRVMDKRDY